MSDLETVRKRVLEQLKEPRAAEARLRKEAEESAKADLQQWVNAIEKAVSEGKTYATNRQFTKGGPKNMTFKTETSNEYRIAVQDLLGEPFEATNAVSCIQVFWK